MMKILSSDLKKNLNFIKTSLGRSSDIVIREFRVGKDGKIKMALIYTDGLVDSNVIQNFILKILMFEIKKIHLDSQINYKKKIFSILKDFAIPEGEVGEVKEFENLFINLLSGATIILIDDCSKGFNVNTKSWQDRGVTESTSQAVVRGPKDSFTETIRTNTALIRRKIKDSNLWIESKQIGRKTKTDISIAYMNGIANDKIVQEVNNRLDKIDIDKILESENIEELIQDETYTPFPTVFNTERPDVVAAALLEGRVAILVDGTPFVLIVPALFVHFMQSPEDYYQRADISTLIRLLRYFSFLIALLTPSLYIALTTYHQEMLPTPLLISIVAQRSGIPFPALVEAFMMELTFEILREAGIRLPKTVGSAISIVGALVLGEAAVQAGIVSPVMVIVVSITAISSFVFPSYNMAITIRMLRFIFMILGGTFGLYGITLGLITLVLHICSIRSFGIPYMTPFAPFNKSGHKDTIVRFPLWKMFTRPQLTNQKNIFRQKSPASAKPKPPQRN